VTINDNLKASAIAKLKGGDSIIQVAEECGLPEKLVEEWFNKLEPNDLIHLQANLNAIQRVADGEILSPSEVNRQRIQDKLEITAIDLIDAARANIYTGDLAQSKSIQLLSASCSMLYKSFVGSAKGTNGDECGSTTLDLIEELGLD